MRKKKIKVGDSVKISEQNLSAMLFDHHIHKAIANEKGKVESVAGSVALVSYNIPFSFYLPINLFEKIKTSANDELQEEYVRFMSGRAPITFAEAEAGLDEFMKEELDRVHHPEKYTTYEVRIDNVAINWQKFEANLAKELSVVYAKQGIDPMEAVGKAKEIVKQLKNK